MKRTCNGCRAFERVPGVSIVSDKCNLGYRQKESSPAEQCPKPKTIDKFLELLTR